MSPAERSAMDERDRRLVAEAPPIRPEVIEMLRRDGFPFTGRRMQKGDVDPVVQNPHIDANGHAGVENRPDAQRSP